ncbi:hypothetical protein FIV42_15700 [Persicimonas caeni]|uniref:Uncharacterized protein n=1 Tax=Persicimonas caeni TaxID=2292766 RepID=A0A4Y6PUW1_PERCE|nr:hypothetical protein [Persicimonas caeni]QDG52134.1 hypothetical protein FIV42_15700 [Persicimonas caeni]QED33356.1 hypothetical protein FRD00_15695 [Persicimonas caeni]
MGARQLDSKLLAAFTSDFFGYGNLAADSTVDIVEFGRRAGIDEDLPMCCFRRRGVCRRRILGSVGG